MRTPRTLAALLAGTLLLLGGALAQGEVKRFELVARSDVLHIGDGIHFKGFTFDGTSPATQMVVQEGDTVEITVRNEDTVTHGLSIHAANTQTSNFVGNIAPGQTKTVTFTADDPGVFMFHCAPGGHGIMAHTMGGQFGMFVVEPNEPTAWRRSSAARPTSRSTCCSTRSTPTAATSSTARRST
jgi:nitrite reductase (NO-forming)